MNDLTPQNIPVGGFVDTLRTLDPVALDTAGVYPPDLVADTLARMTRSGPND